MFHGDLDENGHTNFFSCGGDVSLAMVKLEPVLILLIVNLGLTLLLLVVVAGDFQQFPTTRLPVTLTASTIRLSNPRFLIIA
jgi:hypothetical protein